MATAPFPAFALNAKVNDAAFQYPDLPLPARSIFLDLALTNPGGSADSTVVKLDRFHLRIGRNPVEAAMVLRTPVSDPNVDLTVKGKLDLADVRRTLKFEGIDQLTGTVAADAAVKTRMSDIDKKQYDRVAASGTVDVGDLTLTGKTLPLPSRSGRHRSGSGPSGRSSPLSLARSAAAISRHPARSTT